LANNNGLELVLQIVPVPTCRSSGMWQPHAAVWD